MSNEKGGNWKAVKTFQRNENTLDLFTALCVHGVCIRSLTRTQYLEYMSSYICIFFHLRADKGGENVGVKHVKETMRGPNHGSHIEGKSVHNTRIGRLWCDVYYSVIQTFYQIFYYLESQAYLDPDCIRDICCIHYVYLPVINNTLFEFREAYNHHPTRTCRNRSPYQMWCGGCLAASNQHQTGVRSIFHDDPVDGDELYGHDPLAPAPEREEDRPHVILPTIILNVIQEHHHLIAQYAPRIDGDCADYYISNYCSVRDVLTRLGYGWTVPKCRMTTSHKCAWSYYCHRVSDWL